MNNYPEKQETKTPAVPKLKVSEGAMTKEVSADQSDTWLECLADAFGVHDSDAVASLLSDFATANFKFTPENCAGINALISNLSQIKPEDSVEAMLGMQMITCHRKALKMMEQANKSGTSFNDSWSGSLNLADKLMRTYTRQVEVLARYRRGGKQTVKVE